jgi:hypothetical protein
MEEERGDEVQRIQVSKNECRQGRLDTRWVLSSDVNSHTGAAGMNKRRISQWTMLLSSSPHFYPCFHLLH